MSEPHERVPGKCHRSIYAGATSGVITEHWPRPASLRSDLAGVRRLAVLDAGGVAAEHGVEPRLCGGHVTHTRTCRYPSWVGPKSQRVTETRSVYRGGPRKIGWR